MSKTTTHTPGLLDKAKRAITDADQARGYVNYAHLSIKDVQMARNCPRAQRAAVRMAKALSFVRLAERDLAAIAKSEGCAS